MMFSVKTKTLKTDISNIINNNYTEYVEQPVVTEDELAEIKQLVQITLECAYDERATYDKEAVDNIVHEFFREKIMHHKYSDKIPIQQFKYIIGDQTPVPETPSASTAGSPDLNSKLEELRSRDLTSGIQRDQNWLKIRQNHLTASTIAAAAGLMGNASRQNLLLEKASWGEYGSFGGGTHTHFGNRFEEVTNDIYCYRKKTVIHEFGMIRHKTVSFLGASTDGVSGEGRNIEIKSLSSRKLVPGKIKKEYFHQMQLQMECLELEFSDFLEAKYTEFTDWNEFVSDFYLLDNKNEHVEKGCMIEVYNIEKKELEYMYSPINLFLDDKKLKKWINEESDRISDRDDVVYLREMYWVLSEFSCVEVKRDPKWAKTYIPKLQEFWNEVEHLRDHKNELDELIQKREEQKQMRKNKKKDDDFEVFTVCMI